MNKVFKAGILSLACLFACLGLITAAQAQKAPQKDAPRVMVFPFQVDGGPEVEKLRGELQSMIIQRLSAKGVPDAYDIIIVLSRHVETVVLMSRTEK